MLLIPAIDIKDGHCVRLRQGDLTSNITVFNTDPVAQAVIGLSSAPNVCIWLTWTRPEAESP